MRKYINVFFCQMKNNYIREAVYRANFLTNLIVDLIWLGVEFILFTVIYSNTSSIGGWTQNQTYFFLGVLFASDALFTIFFTRNLWMFNDLVNKGDLDILLTKPISSLFLALTRWMGLTSILNFLMGVGICIKFGPEAGFQGGVAGWSLFLFWLLIGCSSALVLRFLFSVCVFWTDRSWALSRLYYQFYGFATKPDVIYPRAVRYLILTVLPFAFIGSVPARALMKGIETSELIQVLVVIAIFAGVDWILWRKGLQRYQSASS